MPYIKQEQRVQVDAQIKELANSILNTIGDDKTQRAGVLNYTITKLLPEIYTLDKVRYSDLNEIIGMLECCKHEFYRMGVVPYENLKLLENGSVLGNVAGLTAEYLDLNIKLTAAEMDLQESLDNIKKIKDENFRNSCFKENPSEENDSKDPFYEFVKSKKWLLCGSKLVAPYETAYDVLYLDDQLRIKKGHSGLLFLGAERIVWPTKPGVIFTKEVFTKEIGKNFSFSNEELEEYYNKKLPLLKQVGGGNEELEEYYNKNFPLLKQVGNGVIKTLGE